MIPVSSSVQVADTANPRFGQVGTVLANNADSPETMTVKFDDGETLEVSSHEIKVL